MYGLLGERRLTEWEIAWLPGYEGSKPVRIGNAAVNQLQLDIFGEVMDAFHQGRNGKLVVDEVVWAVQRALLDHLEAIWDQPDEGIWEMRAGRRQYTYSKLMAWVAFDGAIKSVEDFRLEGPVERWRALRGRIHEEICRHAFDPTIGAFVQSYGSKSLDASLLLMPTSARRSAYERVSHLLLELFVRLSGVGLTAGMTFPMPLTQELIGDALGLTTVHVNRTLRSLRDDKLVTIDGKSVTIIDFEALSLLSDFENSYLGDSARALWS